MHGIALAGNVENALLAGSGKFAFPSPKWPADPPTPDFLDGPRVAAFDTQKESCEQIDIPDAAARAFRDYKGTIHLIASHYVTRAGLGPSLETAKHNCQVVYKSPHDGNIADFNDSTWLNAFYNIDGKRIVALGHMEYHGWEHAGMCASKTDTAACWYNVDTYQSDPRTAAIILRGPNRRRITSSAFLTNISRIRGRKATAWTRTS